MTYHPPEPLRRVVPRFTADALRSVATPLTVDVQVHVDAAGKVTQALIVPQRGLNPFIVERVVGAARQWTFKPARRGDEPIPSEFVLQFRIAP